MGGRSCLSQDLTRTCLGRKSMLTQVIHKTSRQGQDRAGPEQVQDKAGPRQGRWRACRWWWPWCAHQTCSPTGSSPPSPRSAGPSPRPPPPSPCKGTQQHSNCLPGFDFLAASGHCSRGRPRTPALSFLPGVLVARVVFQLSGCPPHRTPLAAPLARCRSSRTLSLFFCGTIWQQR